MSSRERILVYVTAATVALAMGWILFAKLILDPTAQHRKDAQETLADIERLRGELQIGPVNRAQLVRAAGRSFGKDPETASAASRAMLYRTVTDAGLSSRDVSLTPVRGRIVRGGREVGWIVRLSGSPQRLTHLLYLLQQDPSLHRLDTVTWSSIDKTTDLSLTFKFMTLVLTDAPTRDVKSLRSSIEKLIAKHDVKVEDLAKEPKLSEPKDGAIEASYKLQVIGTQQDIDGLTKALSIEPLIYRVADPVEASDADSGLTTAQMQLVVLIAADKPPVRSASIGDKARRSYDLVAERDIFRAYVKRPPPPPPPPPAKPKKPTKTTTKPPPPPPPPPATIYRVVGLPTWGETGEVVVEDSKTQKTRTYKLGADLAGGEIVMIDYRPLPHPEKPKLMSTSRVLIRVGRLVYAVELGQTLKQKRVLTPALWPLALQPKKEPAPAKAPPEAVPTSTSDTDDAKPDAVSAGDNTKENAKDAAPSTGDATRAEDGKDTNTKPITPKPAEATADAAKSKKPTNAP